MKPEISINISAIRFILFLQKTKYSKGTSVFMGSNLVPTVYFCRVCKIL